MRPKTITPPDHALTTGQRAALDSRLSSLRRSIKEYEGRRRPASLPAAYYKCRIEADAITAVLAWYEFAQRADDELERLADLAFDASIEKDLHD